MELSFIKAKQLRVLIVGAGLSGIVSAERFASAGARVTIFEKRNHIGGNCYDFRNREGIWVHRYGPHIFHTDNELVWDYLSQFTQWSEYEHKVLCKVKDKIIPLPFNLNSLYSIFPRSQAYKLECALMSAYPQRRRVSILELRKSTRPEVKNLADFIYQNVFLGYTQKQWGKSPEEINEEIIARVPIVLAKDNRYFHDKYQAMPLQGYTNMFFCMLDKGNISLKLNTDFFKTKSAIKFDILIYTGPLDQFFDYKYGKLSYRSVGLKFKTIDQENYQRAAVVNYPDLRYDFTRVTEFKKLTGQKCAKTTISKEYPGEKGFLAWPLLDNENDKKAALYKKELEGRGDVFLIGRLAEYKYYDMDDCVYNALLKFEQISKLI